MLIRHKADLQGTPRAITGEMFSTTRFLLREDEVGFSLTDVTLKRGSSMDFARQHHSEVGYCLEGRATLEDLSSGEIHPIGPGSLWSAQKGERFRLKVLENLRLITIFTPALVGPEINDENGSFPLLE